MNRRTNYARRVALGLLMLSIWSFGIFWPLYDCFRTLWYKSTKGHVLLSRLEARNIGEARRFKPIIEYSYMIGANEYSNDRFSLFNAFDSEESAELVIQRYRPNETCTVFFDPSNPQSSVLSKELPTLLVFFGISSFVLMVVYFGLITFSFLRSSGPRL